jgi:hypothetical protein
VCAGHWEPTHCYHGRGRIKFTVVGYKF